ncbi:MAG: alpha/beta fold hydrolase [Ruminococcus sp.]|nr:alpha/beta fold hydrolase [Ruminococcus sp.]
MRKLFIAAAAALLLASCSGADSSGELSGTSENNSTVSQGEAKILNTTGKYNMQELGFTRDGQKIYGKLYLPEGEGKLPLVIIAHGFGGNLSMCDGYAKYFAKNGFATYVFDFIGGGYGIKSDGKLTEMSVLTEAADMDTVLDGLKEQERIDTDNIFLMGCSQGGFVATYTAAKRPSEVKGLVAYYPAYVLQDDAKKSTPDVNNIPETINLMGVTVGGIYNRDALSFDIYEVMAGYTGNALLIHGTADNIVPVSYSERAAETLPHAELMIIDKAGHGFSGTDDANARTKTLEFLKKNYT